MMFFKWNVMDPFYRDPIFNGVDNFIYVFSQDNEFWSAWYRTFLFVGVTVPIEFALGFILALALNRKLKFARMIKSLILIPLAMAPVAVGSIWRIMYSPMYGVVNYFGSFVGLPPLEWVASKDQALISAAIVDIWQWTPFVALVLLAGLQSLPTDPFEAALVDGASSKQIFRHLTLPMMRNIIIVIVVLRLMDAIKTFDILYTLTYHGPGTATSFVSWQISKTAFRRWWIGIAAAESFVTALIISFLILIFIRMYSRMGK
jgi:multiple sugar transport system permease protein